MAADEVREVVLPLEASVGAHPRVEVDAALGRPARPAESEGQRAVDHLVAGRPVGRAGEEVADLRRARVRVDPGVMSMITSSRTRSGRDAATAAAVRPPSDWPDQQLRTGGPRLDAGRDVGREDAPGVGDVGAPRGVAVAGQVDRQRGQARAPGSSCPTCARSARRRAGTSRPAARRRSAARSACARPSRVRRSRSPRGIGRVDAGVGGLLGQEGELVDGFAHPVILPGPGGRAARWVGWRHERTAPACTSRSPLRTPTRRSPRSPRRSAASPTRRASTLGSRSSSRSTCRSSTGARTACACTSSAPPRPGVTADVIAQLPVWRESGVFSDRERAGLELAEAFTFIHEEGVPDEVYNRVGGILSETGVRRR